MSDELLRLEVLPLYAQVAIHDADTDALPDWETGEERAVATEHAVLVATRPDSEGEVVLRVVSGSLDRGDLVFDGILQIESGKLEVGNSLAGTVARLPVSNAGPYRVQIAVEPADAPAAVTVAVEPA